MEISKRLTHFVVNQKNAVIRKTAPVHKPVITIYRVGTTSITCLKNENFKHTPREPRYHKNSSSLYGTCNGARSVQRQRERHFVLGTRRAARAAAGTVRSTRPAEHRRTWAAAGTVVMVMLLVVMMVSAAGTTACGGRVGAELSFACGRRRQTVRRRRTITFEGRPQRGRTRMIVTWGLNFYERKQYVEKHRNKFTMSDRHYPCLNQSRKRFQPRTTARRCLPRAASAPNLPSRHRHRHPPSVAAIAHEGREYE